MATLARDHEAFRARGALVVVVGPEGPDAMRAFWREHAMPYVGLADPRHNAANLYAQEVNPLKLGRMPAQFIIDLDGVVRYAHYGASMSDIPPDATLLEVLDGLSSQAARTARDA